MGENLQDHVALVVNFTSNQNDTYDNNVLVANEYLQKQRGPLSSIGAPYVVGTGYTNNTLPEYPDFQLFFGTFTTGCAPGEVGALRSDGRRQITVIVVNVHPKSRGTDLLNRDPDSEISMLLSAVIIFLVVVFYVQEIRHQCKINR